MHVWFQPRLQLGCSSFHGGGLPNNPRNFSQGEKGALSMMMLQSLFETCPIYPRANPLGVNLWDWGLVTRKCTHRKTGFQSWNLAGTFCCWVEKLGPIYIYICVCMYRYVIYLVYVYKYIYIYLYICVHKTVPTCSMCAIYTYI